MPLDSLSLQGATPATARQLRDRQAWLIAQGPALAAIDVRERLDAILAAVALLLDHSGPVGDCLDTLVAPSSGLSKEMVRWAVKAALGGLSTGGMQRMVSASLAPSPGLTVVRPTCCHLVLAGNVFTACLQPVLIALGLGIPVFCKAPVEQTAFPLLLHWAFERADPRLAAGFDVVGFSRDDADSVSAFLAEADLVIAYGGDDTIRSLRRALPATTRLIEHGHGISAAYVDAAHLDPETAAGLALDIAAYDQRGCMSPQILWLDRTASAEARRAFAALLDTALSEIEESLPRGPLDNGTAARQMQWRAVAAIAGDLIEARDHAIACMSDDSLGPGPCARNILVRDCAGPRELVRNLRGYGIHLKQIGLSCDSATARALIAALAPNQAPRLCRIGAMQMPPIDAFSEGVDPARGLLKWIQSDL